MSADLNKMYEDLQIIWGAAGIARALGLKDSKAGRRKIFHMLERGQLKGAVRIGGRWAITRQALLANFDAVLRHEE